jgi:hypothetical protein
MAKIDFSEFYRNFPMAFHHWKDLGFKWQVFGEEEPAILCDTRMPFGLSTAPAPADRLTSAIVRHMKSEGFSVVGCYFNVSVARGPRPTSSEWEATNVSVARGPRRIRGARTTAYLWRGDHGVTVARGPRRICGAGTTA